MPKTDTAQFVSELNGGVFEEKLSHILSEAALGALEYGSGKKAATVQCTFTIKPIGDNQQVMISHKLSNAIPTKRGKKAEEDTTETPMFVGKGGIMTINQPRIDNNNQYQLKKEKDGKVSTIR